MTPRDKREPIDKIDVSLNNELLVRGMDYFWTPGKLVLMRQRPRPPVRSLRSKLQLLVTLQWDELRRKLVPYPDLVVVENWGMGDRDIYLFGTPDFDKYVCYEEDL